MVNNLKIQFADEIMSLPIELAEKLELWIDCSEAYYNTEEPIMSDESFDSLSEELQLEIEKYPFIHNIINKSIQTVDGLQNVEETSEMISLKKIKWSGFSTIQEVIRFLNPKRQNLNYFYGLKFDGMAIKYSNQNGVKKILTRGGQDVTSMLINHKDFIKITRNITHGELVIKKSTFLEKYADEYENPRNCILGVLKQNPNDLDFIECTDGISPLLTSINPIPLNIESNLVWQQFQSNLNLENFYFQVKEKYQYQIDGIVVGYETDIQEIKDNYPLNIVAVKFKSPSAKAKVIGIDWSQKKSGNLTPVILIEPTKLDGSTINKVSGYNYSNLKKNHIGIGSEVLITKSGDIIPVVEKVLIRSSDIPMPEVDYSISGKHLVAINNEDSITYKFILALKLLQIDGIGPVIAEQIGSMVNYDIIELFDTNNKPKIISVLGTGAVWHKFENFYNTKSIGLDLLIELLQFDRCGKTLSKKFAEIILKTSSDISGIDKNVLNNVCRGEGFQKIQVSMKRLLEYGVKVTKPVKIDDATITFEMTGSPPNMTKADFIKKMKERFPNSTATTLTKETKYLICDDINGTSSKLNKARKLNIKIVTYLDALNHKF